MGPTSKIGGKVTRRRNHHRGQRVAGGGDVRDRRGGGGGMGWTRLGPVGWCAGSEKPDLSDLGVAHGPRDSASFHLCGLGFCYYRVGAGHLRFRSVEVEEVAEWLFRWKEHLEEIAMLLDQDDKEQLITQS